MQGGGPGFEILVSNLAGAKARCPPRCTHLWASAWEANILCRTACPRLVGPPVAQVIAAQRFLNLVEYMALLTRSKPGNTLELLYEIVCAPPGRHLAGQDFR